LFLYIVVASAFNENLIIKNELFKIGQKVRVIGKGFNSIESDYIEGFYPDRTQKSWF